MSVVHIATEAWKRGCRVSYGAAGVLIAHPPEVHRYGSGDGGVEGMEPVRSLGAGDIQAVIEALMQTELLQWLISQHKLGCMPGADAGGDADGATRPDEEQPERYDPAPTAYSAGTIDRPVNRGERGTRGTASVRGTLEDVQRYSALHGTSFDHSALAVNWQPPSDEEYERQHFNKGSEHDVERYQREQTDLDRRQRALQQRAERIRAKAQADGLSWNDAAHALGITCGA